MVNISKLYWKSPEDVEDFIENRWPMSYYTEKIGYRLLSDDKSKKLSDRIVNSFYTPRRELLRNEIEQYLIGRHTLNGVIFDETLKYVIVNEGDK